VTDHDDEPVVEIPIDGVLDLHAFHARDARYLVPDYLDACRSRGILDVRIIHGKGTGAMRRTVHALLDRHPSVSSYRLGERGEGGWGATVVRLSAPPAKAGPAAER